MTDEIRTLINIQFTTVVFDLADLDGVNKTEIETRIKCPLVELFDLQKNADRAKKALKADFNKAVALYLCTYQASSRIDFAALEKKLVECQKVFVRHLGKDKVDLLRLLSAIAFFIKEKPKGLLGAA